MSVQAGSIGMELCPLGGASSPQADADGPSTSVSAEFDFPDDDEVVVVFR